jgi:hypothetical protein
MNKEEKISNDPIFFSLFFSVEGTQKYPNTTATEVSHNLCTKSERSVINLIVNIHYNNS